MDKEVLKWLDRKKEYMEQLSGTGTKTDTKDWVFRQFVEVVTYEQQVREMNQQLIELTIDRDQVVNKIQQITNMLEQVVEAKMMDVAEEMKADGVEVQ